MSGAPPTGVVVDTMVISWLCDERPNPLAEITETSSGRHR